MSTSITSHSGRPATRPAPSPRLLHCLPTLLLLSLTAVRVYEFWHADRALEAGLLCLAIPLYVVWCERRIRQARCDLIREAMRRRRSFDA